MAGWIKKTKSMGQTSLSRKDNMVEMLCWNIWSHQWSCYTGCNERSLNQLGLELRFDEDVACW